MRSDSDIFALFSIASARLSFSSIETNLATIIKDIDPVTETPLGGRIDIYFMALQRAESQFSLIKPTAIESVAGAKAAAALQGYKDSFRGIHETYGLACGPDRTAADVADLHTRFHAIATEAHQHFTAYKDEVDGLDAPSQDEHLEAMQRARLARRDAVAPGPSPVTPRIRLPLDRKTAALQARIILGYAFGGLTATYLRMQHTPSKYLGMIAIENLSSITAYVGATASRLEHRCLIEDSVFMDHTRGISDDLNALFDDLQESVINQRIPPEEIAALANTLLPRISRTGAAIRQIDKLEPR